MSNVDLSHFRHLMFVLFFLSWNHVQWNPWLLAEDRTRWGWQGFFQGSLVQCAQRHGRCFCAGVVRWVEEVHLIVVRSLSNWLNVISLHFYGLCILPYLWEQTSVSPLDLGNGYTMCIVMILNVPHPLTNVIPYTEVWYLLFIGVYCPKLNKSYPGEQTKPLSAVSYCCCMRTG